MNFANDQKEEHFVNGLKTVLKGPVAKQTLTAVERATKASWGLKGVSDNFDRQCQIAPVYTLHTSLSKQDDKREISELISELTVNARA